MIHPDHPFTEDESAAAWIVQGISAEEARAGAAAMRLDLQTLSVPKGDSWWSSRAPLGGGGDFLPLARLLADVHANGTLLSDVAREAALAALTRHLSADEADRRLDELDKLGPSWAAKRATFFRLLTAGTL